MKLNRVIRLDSTKLDRAFFTEEGYLIDTPIVTTTGIFEYANSDGSVRRELRLPEEVFDPDSLASYAGKPVIVTHDAGLVTKDNVSDEAIGTILTPGYRDGDSVRAKIVIHDTDEMKRSRLKELSLGYNLDLDETPGEWQGQHYDAIQRNIRINHLALVQEARAGNTARLNIDSREKSNTDKGEHAMSKVAKKTKRSDGVLSAEELAKAIVEYQERHAKVAHADADDEKQEAEAAANEAVEPEEAVTEPVEEAEEKAEKNEDSVDDVEKLKGDAEDLAAENKMLREEIEKLKAQLDFKDSEKVAEDSKDEECQGDSEDEPDKEDEDDEEPDKESEEDVEREDDDEDPIPDTDKGDVKSSGMNADSVDEMIRTRVQIGITANKLNLDGLEKMKLIDAKKAIVKAVRPTLNLDGKNSAYVDALFDLACKDVDAASRKDTKYQRKQMFNGDSKAANVGSAANEARQKMIDRHLERKVKEDK